MPYFSFCVKYVYKPVMDREMCSFLFYEYLFWKFDKIYVSDCVRIFIVRTDFMMIKWLWFYNNLRWMTIYCKMNIHYEVFEFIFTISLLHMTINSFIILDSHGTLEVNRPMIYKIYANSLSNKTACLCLGYTIARLKRPSE